VIRLTRPWLGDEELRAVEEVLRSGMLVSGARVEAFERAVATRCDRGHAVAVSSGTSALHLSLLAVGIGPGDEVLVPGFTWPSPAHAVMLCGAAPILVDVDPDEWNASADGLAAARTARTKAAIVIDQFGVPARHDAIREALGDLPVIEDAACSIGSTIDDRPCGSFGAIACLSFHPRKVITTGEGGMCLTDDGDLAASLRTLRNHGLGAPGAFTRASGNHRMTEMAAAMGLAQLAKLDAILSARRELGRGYREALPELTFQAEPPGSRPNLQTMGALLPAEISPADCIARLRAADVEAGILSYALHRQPSTAGVPLPVCASLEARGIALPLHPGMTAADQGHVIDSVRGILRASP